MYKICIELHINKHIKDTGMHKYVVPNIVQHGVESCTKIIRNVGGCLQEVAECRKKQKKT
jgi:hypothetical protein